MFVSAAVTSSIVALLTFIAGAIGMFVQNRLPAKHSTELSRDMIGGMVGLVSLLLALVLGTLVGASYGTYATQKAELEVFAARCVQLDLALAEYGPETLPARQRMKETLTAVEEAIWGPDDPSPSLGKPSDALALSHLRQMDEYLASLDPKTPAQRQFAGSAAVSASLIEQTRILIPLQLASSVSRPLLMIVVSWAAILFFGYGILSRVNGTTLVALALGAFAVGSAIFLIFQLSQPFAGYFRIPPAAMEQMLAEIGK